MLRSVVVALVILHTVQAHAAHKTVKHTVKHVTIFLPAVPYFTMDGVVAALYDPSPSEAAALDWIGLKENHGDYETVHFAVDKQQKPQHLSDVEKTKVTIKSHAFGKYGFQPGTYRVVAYRVGLDPEDISPLAQDIAALHLLRKVGLTSPYSWGSNFK